MTRFNRSGKQILITFADFEEAALESLVEQFIDLLEGEEGEVTHDDSFAQWEAELASSSGLDHTDPVIVRLFPAAYRDDPNAEAEFRRFTEAAQRRTKIDLAKAVRDALLETNGGQEAAVIRTMDADAWLKTLSAIRLVLAVRLGIDSADDVEALGEFSGDDRPVMLDLFEWLGMLLEGLVNSLD